MQYLCWRIKQRYCIMEREMILNSIAELVHEAYGLDDVKFALVVVEEKEDIERLIYKGNIGAGSLFRIMEDHLNYIKYETSRPATDTSAQ